MKSGKIICTAFSLFVSVILAGCSMIGTGETFTPPEYIKPYEIVEVEPKFQEDKNSDWYRDFCRQAGEYETRIVVDGKLDKELVKGAFRQINNDRPDIFWLGSCQYDRASKRTVWDFDLIDGCSEDTIETMHAELEKSADNIISMIPEGVSDYEKILFVHDYIALHTEYDNSIEFDVENTNGLMYTAYGCLVDGKAVCQGYAEAFTYIMNRLGIESGVCNGDTYVGGHAWNYVLLDGSYYWVDITWDDMDSEIMPIQHSYFLFNDEMLSRTRWLDPNQNFAPVCDTESHGWFSRNETLFDSYDIGQIAEAAKNAGAGESFEMMFTDYDTYCTALTQLFGEGDIMDIKGFSVTSSYYCDDRNYIVNIIY